MLKVLVKRSKTEQTIDLYLEKGNPNAFKQMTIDGLNIILGFIRKCIKLHLL